MHNTKNIFHVLVIFLMMLFVCLPIISAQDGSKANLDAVLLKMEQINLKMQDMQLDYTQDLVYTSVDEKQTTKGQIKYKDKNHICIYQKPPQEQYVYINGSKITTYVPANKQAIVENWKNILNNDEILMTIIDFNKNWKAFKKNHIIELNGETDSDYILYIKSKNPTVTWSLYIELNKKTLLIDSAMYSNKNYTINIALTNYSINNNFSDDTFKFVPTKDIDIIDF